MLRKLLTLFLCIFIISVGFIGDRYNHQMRDAQQKINNSSQITITELIEEITILQNEVDDLNEKIDEMLSR